MVLVIEVETQYSLKKAANTPTIKPSTPAKATLSIFRGPTGVWGSWAELTTITAAAGLEDWAVMVSAYLAKSSTLCL